MNPWVWLYQERAQPISASEAAPVFAHLEYKDTSPLFIVPLILGSFDCPTINVPIVPLTPVAIESQLHTEPDRILGSYDFQFEVAQTTIPQVSEPLVHKDNFPVLGEFVSPEFNTPSVSQSWNSPRTDYPHPTPEILGSHSAPEFPTPITEQFWSSPVVHYHHPVDEIQGSFSFVASYTPSVSQAWNILSEQYHLVPIKIPEQTEFPWFDSSAWRKIDNDLVVVPEIVQSEFSLPPTESIVSSGWLTQQIDLDYVQPTLIDNVTDFVGVDIRELIPWLVFHDIHPVFEMPMESSVSVTRQILIGDVKAVLVPEYPDRRIIQYGRLVS